MKLPVIQDQPPRQPKPEWLKVRISASPAFAETRKNVREHGLHTVCEEARCPNIGDCWARGTATIMLLGDTCTRSCGFCAVKTGRPGDVNWDEPRQAAESVALMNLKHVVITSVNRDDLKDGGSTIWAQTIEEIRRQSPGTSVEVLIPDFQGKWDNLQRVIDAAPDILNHNMETVRSLTKPVRKQAKYDRSLELLRRATEAGMNSKTGFMVGLGESLEELREAIAEVREAAGVRILTIGQYLQPTKDHLPVERFVHPDEFAELREFALTLGFAHVESGPLVRSSYHAEEQVDHSGLLHKTA